MINHLKTIGAIVVGCIVLYFNKLFWEGILPKTNYIIFDYVVSISLTALVVSLILVCVILYNLIYAAISSKEYNN